MYLLFKLFNDSDSCILCCLKWRKKSVIKPTTWKDNGPKSLCCSRDAHDCSEPHESNPPHSTSLKVPFDVICSTPGLPTGFFFRQKLFMHFISSLSLIVRRSAFQCTYRSRFNHFVTLGIVQTLLHSPSTLPHFHPFLPDESSIQCLLEIRVENDCCVEKWMAGSPRNADAVF